VERQVEIMLESLPEKECLFPGEKLLNHRGRGAVEWSVPREATCDWGTI